MIRVLKKILRRWLYLFGNKSPKGANVLIISNNENANTVHLTANLAMYVLLAQILCIIYAFYGISLRSLSTQRRSDLAHQWYTPYDLSDQYRKA